MIKATSYINNLKLVAEKLSQSSSIGVVVSSSGNIDLGVLNGIIRGLKRRVGGNVTLLLEGRLPPQSSERWGRLVGLFDSLLLFNPGLPSKAGLIFSLEARMTGAYVIHVIREKSDKSPGCDFAIVSSLPGVFPDLINSIKVKLYET